MSAFLKDLLIGIFSLFGSWISKESAESDASKAKALEEKFTSFSEGKAEEAELHVKQPVKPPFNPSQWMLLFAVLPLLVLPGCSPFTRYVTVDGYRPVPPILERPEIPDEPAEWSQREVVLITYICELEELLAKIRTQAIKYNLKNGYPVDYQKSGEPK